MAVKNTTIFM